jgi:hypothetical protein
MTDYCELEAIDMVSYRSLHMVIRVGKQVLPIVARIIPGMSGPLMLGNNYKDSHMEDPDTKRKVNTMKRKKVFFFQEKDVFIQRKRVTNYRYYTHLFSLECLNTGFTTARFINMENRSVSEMISTVATDYWIYGEYSDGFGKPPKCPFYAKRGG